MSKLRNAVRCLKVRGYKSVRRRGQTSNCIDGTWGDWYEQLWKKDDEFVTLVVSREFGVCDVLKGNRKNTAADYR